MAALRVAGIALAVHVSRAEGGEAALLRCHSPPCRRVPAVPGGLRAAGSQAAPVQSSLANPFGQPAQSGYADLVLDVAHAGRFREPSENERAALLDLRDALAQLPADASAEEIQQVVYEVGRREPFLDKTGKIKTKDGKPGVALDWFNMLYQVLLGQEKGPRFGSFVAVYGLKNTVDMIDGALARSA